jgi:hypothetical protein
MDTFSIIRDALAKTEDDPDKAGLDAKVVEAGRIVAAVQVVVDALTPPDGGRYIVGFADIATAGTSLGERTIRVSSAPLGDRTLSMVEKAVVVATFTAHEIGHTLVTRPRKFPVNLIEAHNAHSGFKSLANIADDIVLEPFMVDRFPILADAFEFTGLWVLRNTSEGPFPLVDTLDRTTSAAGRFNILMHATRYGDIDDIVWTPGKMVAERDWCRDWKRRLLAVPLLDHAGFLALVDEAWDHVRTIDEDEPPIIDEPEPEPEEGEEGEPEPGEGEGEGDSMGQDFDEPTDPDGEPEGSDDDFDEEPDEDDDDEPEGESESEDEGDESEDEGDESEDEGDDGEDGDGEDGDEDGGDTGSGDSESDSDDAEGEDSGDGDGDGESDEDGDEPTEGGDYDGHDGDGDPTGGDGGGGNAEADSNDNLRDEDDFDESEVDETTHDSAETTDPMTDRVAEQAVRTYEATTATKFGIHGTLSTTWE